MRKQIESKITKSKYKLKDFTQTLPNGKDVFDFHKIANTEFNMFLIMTQRGAMGKTFNWKQYAKDLLVNEGKQSMYIMNTGNLIGTAKNDFLKDVKKQNVRKILSEEDIKFWDGVSFHGNQKANNIWLKNGEQDFIRMIPMSSTEESKGSRSDWGTIVWEEFNVKYNRLRNPTELFDSLLHTLEDVVLDSEPNFNFFIFGNSKSMDNEIIWRMGLTHIADEITEVRTVEGYPIIMVISPQFSADEIVEQEQQLKTNFIFNITKQLGTSDHAYFNKSLNDKVNNVKRYTVDSESASLLTPIYTIHHDKKYYNLYRVNDGSYHVLSVRESEKTDLLVVLSSRQMVENALLKKKQRNQLIQQLSNNNISFEDVVSRELFIKSLRS